MKVKDLAGKINLRMLSHHTMFRFINFRSHYAISGRIPISKAYSYWGDFSVNTYFIVYDETENTIIIDVFIDPDERRTAENDT